MNGRSTIGTEDRRLAAETLGAKLGEQPGFVALELQRTPQGCDWLLERWHGLERALDFQGGWSDDQRRLALDMLGTPLELRDGVLPLVHERDREALRARKSTIHDEIKRLETRRADILEPRDQAEQRAAIAGATAEIDLDLTLLRRYEAACHRQQQWALKQFKEGRHGRDTPSAPFASAPTPVVDLSTKEESTTTVVPRKGRPAP